MYMCTGGQSRPLRAASEGHRPLRQECGRLSLISRKLLLTLTSAALLALNASAAVHYVSLSSTNPTPPYLDWTTAATNIQDAVDAATNSDTVLVSNGVYQVGGRLGVGAVTNRVAVTMPLTVQSVNGPAVTIIQGYSVPVSVCGNAAIRCAYLTNGASLLGFTLTNGATGGSTAPNPKLDQFGGGAYCSSSAVLSNCVLVGNSAYLWGGGAFCDLYPGTTVNNCTFLRNSAYDGGGVYGGTLNNCLIISNISSQFGGGTVRGTANNCTLVGNRAVATGGGAYLDTDGVLNNCIIYDNMAEHSPNCYLGASINSCCTTPLPASGTGNITNAPLFLNEQAGNYRLQSNSPCIDAGNNSLVTLTTDADGNPRIIGGMVDIGAYEFQGPIRYVNQASTNPMAPYSDWAHAATNIQDAVDAAATGDTVLVTNGFYANAGRQLSKWDVTNRVAVTNGLVLRSVNGPGSTFIVGYQPSGMSTMTNAVRCVSLGTGCLLSGFTLTNGSAGTGNAVNGGALVCGYGSTAVVSNCVLVGNMALGGGGGASYGTLINCILSGNHGEGGGAAIDSKLINCIVTNNTASWAGGGLGCTATNCLFARNNATNYGGATGFSTLVNCTVVSNSLPAGSGGNGGGSYMDTVFNSIVYGNSAPNGPNCYSSGLAYSCTTPLATGTGNITNAPLFVDTDGGNFQLQSNSPCINAGTNAYAPPGCGLAGAPRIVGGTVDMGAYECQSPPLLAYYNWLQSYGLSTHASSLYADADNDGMNNWQEWVAGTNPTNAASALRLQSVTFAPPRLRLRWNSDTSHNYFVQRSTSLKPPMSFSFVCSNVPGRGATTEFTNTFVPTTGAVFYRIGTTNGGPQPVLETPLYLPARAILTWLGVTNRSYFVERSTNFFRQPPFSLLCTNLPGVDGTISFIDSNPPITGPAFYRIGVQ